MSIGEILLRSRYQPLKRVLPGLSSCTKRARDRPANCFRLQKYVIYFVLAKESTTNRNNFYLCYY